MSYFVQIDDLVREATNEEIVLIEAQRSEAEALAQADKARAKAKVEVIAKLGLTADEVAALLS